VATSKRTRAIVGVFKDRADAERAVEELRRAGFRDSQIGIASADRARGGRKKKGETYAEEGAATGILAGAGAGALVGLGVMAGVIPVIGPAIAGGTLGILLSNAAAGAAAVGLAGALLGFGVPEEEAAWYEGELKAGRTLVTVKATGRQDEAREILRCHGGYEWGSATTTTAARGTAARAVAREGETIEVREEELAAKKRPVKTGEVRVRKDVVTEHKTLKVPVTREEVVIERRPIAGRRASAGPIREEEIRVPVRGEKVNVEKRTVAREEVKVGKRAVADTERVSGTVRKEKVRVEQAGEARVRERGRTSTGK
jgi:uncharacterized protein (TIGR02271 family)